MEDDLAALVPTAQEFRRPERRRGTRWNRNPSRKRRQSQTTAGAGAQSPEEKRRRRRRRQEEMQLESDRNIISSISGKCKCVELLNGEGNGYRYGDGDGDYDHDDVGVGNKWKRVLTLPAAGLISDLSDTITSCGVHKVLSSTTPACNSTSGTSYSMGIKLMPGHTAENIVSHLRENQS